MQINIAPCGLVCSRCDAYRATKLNDPEKLEMVAADWRKRYNCEDIKAELLPCDGCMSEGGRKSYYCGSMCGIRKCATSKGVGVCSECRDYSSCAEIAGFLGHPSEQCKAMKKMLDAIAEVESKMHSAF